MAELPVFEATYQPQVAWTTAIGSGVDNYYSQLQPAVDDNAVYVAARDGKVRAFLSAKGNRFGLSILVTHESNAVKSLSTFIWWYCF